jgi:hypothetical protein
MEDFLASYALAMLIAGQFLAVVARAAYLIRRHGRNLASELTLDR